MFSGCAAKLKVDPHFSFKGAACLIDVKQLAMLGHPAVAAVAIGLTGVLVILATAQWRPNLALRGATPEPELTRL
jgi:hypothetical protein